MAPLRAQLDGWLPINRSLTVLHQETRALRAAFNDFACTNVTPGEIEALHADVNRVQAENAELQTRLATVERLLEELMRGSIRPARRVDHLQERKPAEIGVARADARHAMFAHQDRGVGVVDEIARKPGKLGDNSRCDGGVPVGSN